MPSFLPYLGCCNDLFSKDRKHWSLPLRPPPRDHWIHTGWFSQSVFHGCHSVTLNRLLSCLPYRPQYSQLDHSLKRWPLCLPRWMTILLWNWISRTQEAPACFTRVIGFNSTLCLWSNWKQWLVKWPFDQVRGELDDFCYCWIILADPTTDLKEHHTCPWAKLTKLKFLEISFVVPSCLVFQV